ncbi:hypothetical protein HGRIS_011366 [Hohenbuehelia grisea]
MAWMNNGELEADIVHLKGQVQACHSLFQTFSSARNEQNILLVLHEGRARTRQLDRLVTEMLLRDEADGLPIPTAINAAAIDARMYDYLFHKLDNALEGVNNLIVKRSDWYEEPDEWHSLEFSLVPGVECLSETSRFSRAFFHVIRILQALSSDTQALSIQAITSSLYQLMLGLKTMDHCGYAALVGAATAEMYSRLFDGTGAKDFLYILAETLDWLSFSTDDSDLSLKSAGEAVMAWTALHNSSYCRRYSENLAWALGNYGMILSNAECFDRALEYGQQSLSIIRDVPSTSDPSTDSTMVRWEGSGEASIVHTSRREITRPMEIAWIEVYTLYTYAWILGSSGNYASAFLTGLEAINGCQALLGAMPDALLASSWNEFLGGLQEAMPSWVSITYRPSQRALLASDQYSGRRNDSDNEGNGWITSESSIH